MPANLVNYQTGKTLQQTLGVQLASQEPSLDVSLVDLALGFLYFSALRARNFTCTIVSFDLISKDEYLISKARS
jgi:hypothetical protein